MPGTRGYPGAMGLLWAITLALAGPEEDREVMVRTQIEARGVKDPLVLGAMRAVPRDRFVPGEMRSRAHQDRPLPIGHGQTISQPYIVAFMTEALQVGPGMTVLEIGTGSGYQAAVLAAVGAKVWSIEIVEPLGRQAAKTLSDLGYPVQTRIGDGYQGWPEVAPFDRIIVTAAPDHVPQPLLDQLAVGGRMVIPVGSDVQDLVVIERRSETEYKRSHVLSVLFVPMTGEAER